MIMMHLGSGESPKTTQTLDVLPGHVVKLYTGRIVLDFMLSEGLLNVIEGHSPRITELYPKLPRDYPTYLRLNVTPVPLAAGESVFIGRPRDVEHSSGVLILDAEGDVDHLRSANVADKALNLAMAADTTLSRSHASVQVGEGGQRITVQDLESRNGTGVLIHPEGWTQPA